MPLQPAPVLFPDIVSALAVHLRGVLGGAYAAQHTAEYGTPAPVVAVDASRWRRPAPLVHLVRAGGAQKSVWDYPRVQVDVLAETWDEAHSIVSTVRAAMQDAPLHLPEVKRVSESMGPSWMPDAADGQPRFTWAVELVVAGTHAP